MSEGFDYVQGTLLREQAIINVTEHADEAMKKELLEIGRYICSVREQFTTDAIRYIYERDGETTMREPRVMGHIVRQLQREGLCVPLDEWKQSVWAKNHRRPLRVWRSLIYGGNGRESKL